MTRMKHPPTMDMPARMMPLDVHIKGPDLLRDPLLNKGTAFSDRERDELGLHGLLPPHVGTLEEQVERRLKAFRAELTPLEKYGFLRGLQDTNETIFYALLGAHLEEMLPIVYTPTVGEGCERFSDYWSKPRGLFLSWPHRHRVEQILADPRLDPVRVVVVSDGERILGLGDQGAGGMGIPIGKLALYTACAGLHPSTTLPILLDVGTDNEARLADPLYLGWRQKRVRGADYDAFVEDFIAAVMKRWPNVLLQFEDFARGNAGRLLERYRDRLCTFNDDIQGTAAIAAGTLLSAIQATGGTLADQRIAIFGAGAAGVGIANLLVHIMIGAGLSEREARSRFYAVDRPGLLTDDVPELLDFQRPFAQPRAAVAGWSRAGNGYIDLLDVVQNAKPTTLIGVSGVTGAFNEHVVRAMARGVERPVIFPLSNPTSRAEATPQDIHVWSEGRAVVGTGSPFPPVMRDGVPFKTDQTNNSYVFPGVGLGVLAVDARRVTDAMFEAAARAVAAVSPAKTDPTKPLLPPVTELREVARVVARAVARTARAEGLCEPFEDVQIDARIERLMWRPFYRPYRYAGALA
ncbi:MAG: NAD-dependent malic enzyme [Labilithrix sp.]|nr:NAD-dependent malic enzyme [Labilithrix sp.]MCW5810927.1 NAD-dependent malic enzyme [Labilithrix sp.]